MASHRIHTAQSRKYAHEAAPARFDIRHSAFGVSPRSYQVYAVKSIVDCTHQNCGNRNANFAWVQHFIHHLAPQTARRDSAFLQSEAKQQVVSEAKDNMAGFVLANGSMSSNQSGEGDFESAFWVKTSSLSQRATV